MDEEYDNDYAENYFDNGENDDMDDLGGGGGGDDGAGTFNLFIFVWLTAYQLTLQQLITTDVFFPDIVRHSRIKGTYLVLVYLSLNQAVSLQTLTQYKLSRTC